ncbi:MAG: FAD-dependent oxidoreductase [Chloroflexi bacterium]|nr:MAG: FAD-dependent oxidoreductase [Chloroflexota bacterium]
MGREETVRSLADHTVDLLVIGGGIIGAGIARDAALRGLSIALIEQNDFSSGTTSRPTRLIHGGLRYLELFDFGLVRADMRERETLLGIAPHLVFPLPFVLPMYRPSLWYRFKLRIGMLLYDLLSLDKSLPKRKWLDRAATLDAEPNLDPDGLVGAWRFYDAQVPLARSPCGRA